MRRPAGVGKLAIVQICTKKLEENKYLGTTFFFSVNKHNNLLLLFTTITYQLATSLPDYCVAINNKISKYYTIVYKRILSQFKELIIEPLQELEK